jgi:hypothetical protein
MKKRKEQGMQKKKKQIERLPFAHLKHILH